MPSEKYKRPKAGEIFIDTIRFGGLKGQRYIGQMGNDGYLRRYITQREIVIGAVTLGLIGCVACGLLAFPLK